MLIGSSVESFSLIWACILWCKDLMSLIVGCVTPSLLSDNHCDSASRGTESYAFCKSMKTRNDFARCSPDFSMRWCTVDVKIMSWSHTGIPGALPQQEPAISPGWFWQQLSQQRRVGQCPSNYCICWDCLFGGIGTRRASDQSFGTSLLSVLHPAVGLETPPHNMQL